MNRPIPNARLIIVALVASLAMLACSTPPTRPVGADAVRGKLTQLRSDPQLASRAPVAIREAEAAVAAAEVPTADAAQARHLVIMADRKVDIAMARAQSRLAEDRRAGLAEDRERARLESRTREADRARDEAQAARLDAAEAARQVALLQEQIAALNAKPSDRGLVITLGDVLFASGRSNLQVGATQDLGKLAAFLSEYPERTATIEGHTDNVGGEDYNQALSQRRADAVKAYLVNQGVAAERLTAYGMGEGSPTASNESAVGRQQNRRVEVIISNTVAAGR